jgi:transketolase
MTAPAGGVSGREACRDLIADLLPGDERLICLDSDTGLFDRVDFGAGAARYRNLGIAEQNMMGVAAGLARSGRIPLVNTMATFATTRALESIKVDVALPNLPVRIVATHGGLSAGHLGPTHQALEDLAIMRTLPNMTVLVAADGPTAADLLRQSIDLPGPSYLRLGRGPTPDLPAPPPTRLGHAQVLRPLSGPVSIVACGPYPVLYALEAADELGRRGLDAGVVNLHTVKPLDTAALAAAARDAVVVTVEEHWAAGGVGSAVLEALAESAPGTRVVRIAAADRFFPVAGGQRYLLDLAGISAERIVAAAVSALSA